MAACGLRLASADTLLMLLPLTSVPLYLDWLQISGHMLNIKCMRENNVPVEQMQLRLNPSLVAGFKTYLKANPGHLGLYVIMANYRVLQSDVFEDAGCAPALAALPNTLLATVQGQYGGVLTAGLYDVARMACRAAGGAPGAVAHVFVETWRDILRICLLPAAIAISPERFFLFSLNGLSNSCRCRWAITPYLLQELTGPCKDLLQHLAKCARRLLKDARAGRPTEPVIVTSCASFCSIIEICEFVQEGGSNDGTDSQQLQRLARESLQAVRASSLGEVLEELRKAVAQLTTTTTMATAGSGSLTETDKAARQAQADLKRLSRLYCQVSVGALVTLPARKGY